MSNQSEIRKLAGVHLGKAGDGSVVNPYQTPDAIDPSLLVAVPRHLNRTDYNIAEDNLPFIGFDVWNCYEVSALTTNGYPVSGVLKIKYPANSPSIVESKSLKLFLNSFNMDRLADSVDDVIEVIQQTVETHLGELLDCAVSVKFFAYWDSASSKKNHLHEEYRRIEHGIHMQSVVFNDFNENPGLLEVSPGVSTSSVQRITTNALRSNCQITNQPDWGDIYIFVKGPSQLVERSVLQYIVSMRNESHFHEEIVECVFKRLYDLLPRGTDIAVGALYTRRGGIDINPVRATSFNALDEFAQLTDINTMQFKTARQ
ncbi:hypothetical protein pf16_79 [Pseudomonas phage pf16]|uniref:NADPH-dependent 7-cyano-7-deazaguanine reductase N-terminal domain-containing protein n=1 Tax=Pseudomonas phage pf16 TaxID=1815630 RepID=A0A1S5R3L8_9CAUD|nr:GTP cyclohydrolase [Pseudomonas phage pf16]AND75002.1 hypothetical protein pf16_79 [Pseudomonas phage pf16]